MPPRGICFFDIDQTLTCNRRGADVCPNHKHMLRAAEACSARGYVNMAVTARTAPSLDGIAQELLDHLHFKKIYYYDAAGARTPGSVAATKVRQVGQALREQKVPATRAVFVDDNETNCNAMQKRNPRMGVVHVKVMALAVRRKR